MSNGANILAYREVTLGICFQHNFLFPLNDFLSVVPWSRYLDTLTDTNTPAHPHTHTDRHAQTHNHPPPHKHTHIHAQSLTISQSPACTYANTPAHAHARKKHTHVKMDCTKHVQFEHSVGLTVPLQLIVHKSCRTRYLASIVKKHPVEIFTCVKYNRLHLDGVFQKPTASH